MPTARQIMTPGATFLAPATTVDRDRVEGFDSQATSIGHPTDGAEVVSDASADQR